MQATAPSHQTILHASIGPRTLAAIVVALTALFYTSVALAFHIGAKSFVAALPDFWFATFFCAPVFCLALIQIMARVYFREAPRHPFVFWPSLFVGLSPWLLYLYITLIVA